MDPLHKLAQVLEQRGGLLARLPDPALQAGLRQLASILLAGLGDQGLARWSKQQWDLVLALLEALVAASCDVVLDSGEKEVVQQVYGLAVRLSLLGLEHYVQQPHAITVSSSIQEMQHRLLQLLEALLVEGKARERGPSTIGDISSEVPAFDFPSAACQADELPQCMNEGAEVDSSCNYNEAGSLGSILTLLAGEQLLAHESRSAVSGGLLKPVTTILSATQMFAMANMQCVSRLLAICKTALDACLNLDSDEEDRLAQGKASLVSSILKLLVSITRESGCGKLEKDVTSKLVELAATVPVFLKLTHDVSNADTEDILDNDQAFPLPAVMEGLLQLGEVVLPDQTFFFNLRTYLTASLLDALELSKSRNEASLAQQLPLACTPHVISHLLGMFQDIHAHSHSRFQVPGGKREAGNVGISDTDAGGLDRSLNVQLRGRSFALYQERSHQEHLEVVFAGSARWLDNLIGVTSLLHAQGLKVRPLVEIASSVQSEEETIGAIDCVTVASEDDALFGDLFSESGRNSVNSDGNTQGCSSTKKLDGLYNTPLQTAFQVLSFLKDCAFSPEWHQQTFAAGCKQLTKEHVDIFLQVLFSQSSMMDRGMSIDEMGDVEGSSDLLGQLHKGSFDLLLALILRGALSDALELHLARQMFKEADMACALSEDSLVLLANLLVTRSVKTGDDPVTVEIWKNFTDTLLSKGRNLKVLEMNIGKAAASLPSVIHMEVLFTGFHSLSIPGRMSVLRNLLLALKSFYVCEKQNNIGNALAASSLLVSRLLLAMRYLVLHFNNFPRWLLLHMRDNVRHQPVKAVNVAVEDGPALSLSARIAKKVLKDQRVDEHHLDEVSIQQLFDMGSIAEQVGLADSPDLSSLYPDLSELGQCLSDILETWGGKTVTTVDELILERYIFVLVWNIARTIGPALKPVVTRDIAQQSNGGLLGADFFISVSRCFHSSIQKECTLDVKEWVSNLMHTLSVVDVMLQEGRAKNLISWDFLRQNASLNLLLSSLRAGLWAVSVKGSEGGDYAADISSYGGLFKFLEESVVLLFDDAQFMKLIKVLSSMLAWYVTALRTCLLHVLSSRYPGNKFLASLDLLLKGCLSRSKQQDLLDRSGIGTAIVQSLLRWGSSSTWLAETMALLFGSSHEKGDFRDPSYMFLPALLHGFPATVNPGSAGIASCMLVMETILDTVQELIKCQTLARGGVVNILDLGDLQSILHTVMLDSTFENVHSKCSLLLSTLVPSKEDLTRMSDMSVLKHVENVLLSLCSLKGVDGAVKEVVAVQAAEVINSIRSDPIRFEALRAHFLSRSESDRWARKQLGLVVSESSKGSVQSAGFCLLVDVLVGCTSEVVNVKVLQLLIDLLSLEPVVQSGFKQDLQKKFLSMSPPVLAGWLEHRLLGQFSDVSTGGASARSAPSSVRDLAALFAQALLSSEGKENELRDKLRAHLVGAMLLNLERAFLAYDALAARTYFGLLVQLAVGEPLLSSVTRHVVELLAKLPVNNGHLEGFASLLSFLNSVLSACGAYKAHFQSRTLDGSQELSRLGSAGAKTKQSIFCKSDHMLRPPVEPGGASGDCDATSVEDDEDDATSDGEPVSLERDDEDDASTSERALAARVCTFTSSGSNFMEQHWYFCYTCDLTVSKGCCSVCAKVCHRGHKVVYSRLSRFFCDCGAGGVRGSTCLCLKPRKYVSPLSGGATASTSNVAEHFIPLTSPQVHLPQSDSDSDADEEDQPEGDSSFRISISEGDERKLLALFADLDVEARVLSLCQRLSTDLNLGLKVAAGKEEEIVLGDAKILLSAADLHLKRAYKSGSLDMKIKAEYTNARELKSHLVSGSIVKSLLSVSSRGRLAAGEGDKVTIFDVGQLIGQPTAIPVTVDKTTVKPLSRNSVRFEIVHLAFNSANESYLAVAGFEDCQIFTVHPRGEVTDRLALELALQDAHIRRVAWVPGSQVQLLVVTNKFVKIYDLSQDKISPSHYFTVIEDSIADATVIPVGQGRLVALVLSHQGVLYSQHVGVGADSGSRILTENIQLPDMYRPTKGVSICYYACRKVLLLSYSDGTSLIARMNQDATGILQVSSIFEADSDGKRKPAGLHHWREMFEGSGLFVCLSSARSNSAVAVHIGNAEVHSQYLRAAGNATSVRMDGVASYRPLSKDRHTILTLHDDGSLQVYAYLASHLDAVNSSLNMDSQRHSSSLEAEQVKKLGAMLLGNRASNGTAPVFPLDFFEKTTCITSEVKFGGDMPRNTDSESIKMSLSSEDGFLEGPSASGFRIVVLNVNPEQVMVGCRVHVGNTSASHIPSEVRVFQRTIRLEEGVRCWYDIPFTNSEALLADEEITLTVGPTFNGSSLPRVDNLEIYGRSKDEFGWKEKLDAVLDMESQGHGTAASLSGAGTGKAKHKVLHSGSLPENILSDSLRLLYGYYLAHRMLLLLETDEARVVLSRKKCMPVLEVIFETDRQPLLQSAARHVLRALYPAKETYYQAKDTMRLAGVARSCPLLVSNIAAGGATTSWVVQEFSAQMRSVCEIALHRQSNLASFLEQHGSAVVDGLVKVLWEILVREQLDAQSINNLVIPMVDLIYSYAECLSTHGTRSVPAEVAVAPAVVLLRKLLFSPYEAVRTSCSLAISSRLLQVPLPKQTMLAMDDVAESSRATSSPLEGAHGTSGSAQVMVEEDPSTASVQYCCDGCSTVPILRRRWHCNVCDDFDLCEGCYEVMDADQLPPPHTRDHSMSAILIEMDVGGGDPGDLQYSAIDDLSDESLLQMATELSLQAAGSPSIGAGVEGSDSTGLVHTVLDDSKGFVFSASKSAVNSFLLHRLVEDIHGWMRTSSGSQAVPVMQLFYRLASASSGPLVEPTLDSGSLNLERLIKLLLKEMDLSAPLSVKVRTNFGEVIILVFMFFTLVLRNWHQPGSDHSQSRAAPLSSEAAMMVSFSGSSSPCPSEGQAANEGGSQLDKACSALRQQPFLSYLLNIVQQLSNNFKISSRASESSPPSAGGAACGSLLTARREFASGSFTPYFSDSYAKAHRGDLFGEFHRLLLENTFRLTYSLVRPDKLEKGTDKDQNSRSCSSPELKLEGWQEILCSFINNPHTTFIRKYARKLLLHMCGTKGHYYNVRDAWQLSREVKRLNKLAQKSGGFQVPVSYERSVKLVKCLTVIVDVAAARPRNWQKYCVRHIDVLQFLLNGVFSFGEESVVQTLKLLMLVFYTGKELGGTSARGAAAEIPDPVTSASGAAATSAKAAQMVNGRKKRKGGSDETLSSVSTSDKGYMDMEAAVDQLAAEDGKILRQFVDKFLLEWNATSVRSEAKSVLHGAWHHGKLPFRILILTLLLERVPLLPSYGQNIVEYTDLLTWLLGKGGSEGGLGGQEMAAVQGCLSADVVKRIYSTLCAQNELLANHPNSRIYNTLASLVEFDGYYLESEPCLACSSPEVPYTRMKLDSLKAETKFTDNRILVKCVGSHTIQSVTMNVHDARRSKSVKVLNLYYNNRPVADLSELKNNWSLWKRARCCQLAVNQTELKVEFSIPITACNFMIELDSFYENLQASSLESLQCPRCSRFVTDKHGICSNCHENAYQCRQCRNINYENLDSFLCNECGYSKYGRFEFNFMAKPSFTFDSMENEDDMKKGLAAIEAESENAHRRYQQLLGFKKPLMKLVSSIGEPDLDSQQKDSVQQMMVNLPGSPSFKTNRKIAILGVLYGEKCKMAFDSVSKSVQTLQGLRRVLMSYLERKSLRGHSAPRVVISPRPPNRCFGCANTFVGHCLEWLQVLAKQQQCRQQLVAGGILRELFENNIHQGPRTARIQARAVLCAFTEGDGSAVAELNSLIQQKAIYCLEHHRSMDIASCVRDELQLLSETCSLNDDYWEARLRVVFQLLFRSIELGARHPVISEHIILPCLKIVSQLCTPPKPETEPGVAPPSRPEPFSDEPVRSVSVTQTNMLPKPAPGSCQKDGEQELKAPEVPLINYAEWKNGTSFSDFVRREYTVSPNLKPTAAGVKKDLNRVDYLALKCVLRWKRKACKVPVTDELAAFEESSWVNGLVLSACSQAIRAEMCGLIEVLCSQSSSRRSRFLNLLMTLLPATRAAGESAAEYFELLFKMVETEEARLYLTVRGFLKTACGLIADEVKRIQAQEHSFHTDISQGYILHKLIELLNKFLQVPNIRARFMKEELLAQVLEALLAIRGLIVQKTKLTGDCGRLLRELLDSLLQESYENKRHFIRACIAGLQIHCQDRKDRTPLFILEQLCNIICPSKPKPAYMMVLNKSSTQEEFIRGSMTKNPYNSLEVGPLMRDVKNKICQSLELVGLLGDDYGMELLVAGNIIALDLSVAQVYEQVWRKAHSQAASSTIGASLLAAAGGQAGRECPPMTVTYRLQGLDGEATEPMIKELEDDREESQDPEVEFAITGVMRECGGLDIIVSMVQQLSDEEIRCGQEEVALVLKLLMYCCKIRANRQALLQLDALKVLLDTARRAFSTDAAEPAEGLLLIVESLVTEANENDVGVVESTSSPFKALDRTDGQAANAVLMFLERLSHPAAVHKSNKQQRNNDTVARILPYLTYGEQTAMEVLVKHFMPYLKDWGAFDKLQKQHRDNTKDEGLAQQAAEHQFSLENFVRVTESIRVNSNGSRLKNVIMEKGITKGAIQYLKNAFPAIGRAADHKATSEWTRGLEMPSVPIILLLLRGLSKGHKLTQKCLDEEGVLPLLHALEGVAGENEIGARAENLLDTLADKDGTGVGFLPDKVANLRHATRDEMRRRALRKREELLQGLGMRSEVRSDGGERIVVSRPHIEGLEEIEEEEAGLACMVCREGYRLRPTDMLGTYCYSKRVNLGSSTGSQARAEWVYTTVSHFNVIHFQCHQEAKRADASLKNPKKEWEGATLRNSETLCNNLFPLRGPAVPLVQYSRCVDHHWDNLGALGRADGSRVRLLIYDIVLMLGRFATGASFSVDCKGGGRESNSRLLPFMIQMARHLLDQGGASQRRLQAKSLASYISPTSSNSADAQGESGTGFKQSTPTTPQASRSGTGSSDETVQFMMVQSLLLQSLDDWLQHRRTFLQRAILHAYAQHKQGRAVLPNASPGPPVSSAPSPVRNPPAAPSSPSPVASTTTSSDSSLPKRSSEDLREREGRGAGGGNSISRKQLFLVLHPMLVYIGLVDKMQHYFKSGVLFAKGAGRDVDQVELDQRKVSTSGSLDSGLDSPGSSVTVTGIEPWEAVMKEKLRDVSSMLGFSKDLLEWLEEMQSVDDVQEALDVMGALGDALSGGCTSCDDFVRDAINAGASVIGGQITLR